MRLFPELGELNKTSTLLPPFNLRLKNRSAFLAVQTPIAAAPPNRILMKKLLVRGRVVSFNYYKKALIAYPNRNFSFG